MSEMSDIWRKAFATWPPTFRRKGVVIPDGSEAIPFCDFVMTDSLVVLERATPDNSGARRVAIPFGRIHNLKYTEPLDTEDFLKVGFVKQMPVGSAPRAGRGGQPPASQKPPAGKPRPMQAAGNGPVPNKPPQR